MPKLISDLAIMLLTAGTVAVLFRKFRQPLVLGYILAGFLVGPYMPWFFTVADQASIETWSEIGIIVLMFGLGLEFNLHKLLRMGGAAIITAITEVVGMLVVGYLVGQAMGWSVMDSVFLGGMLSMSSTIIVIKVFDELNVGGKPWAQVVFGSLVIQDIAGIFMMIILSTVSVSQNISGADLALQLGMLGLYLVIWLILGIFLIPTLLQRASRFMNDETLLLVSLGLCFGMVLLAEALGFSSSLGAFLAGSLLAGTVLAEKVEHLVSPIKDLFGSVFFLSVGMMIEPAMIRTWLLPILLLTVVTIAGKLITSALGALLAGQSLENAVACGCSLAQIGEFAFIIASLGTSLHVTGDFLYPIIVAVSVITTLTTPTMIRSAGPIFALTQKLLPRKLLARLERYTRPDTEEPEADSDWAVYLRRYFRVTALYGVLMAGVSILVRFLLLPFLEQTPLTPWMVHLLCGICCISGIALFVRPMLDLHSSAYTVLWVRNRRNRLPLMSLTALRYIIIVLIVFFTLEFLLGINSIWLLLMICVSIFLIYKTRWMSSAYISAEARFVANLNERSLSSEQDSSQWLDSRLSVCQLTCGPDLAGHTLKQHNWRYLYNVSVIRILRGHRFYNIPSGDMELHQGDLLQILGKPEDLRTFRLALWSTGMQDLGTLHDFIGGQEDTPSDVYVYAMPVQKGSPLQGKTIRSSRLRETYDCMVLGLQRNRLPILEPDVEMTIQAGDLVWIFGARRMAEKLLASFS